MSTTGVKSKSFYFHLLKYPHNEKNLNGLKIGPGCYALRCRWKYMQCVLQLRLSLTCDWQCGLEEPRERNGWALKPYLVGVKSLLEKWSWSLREITAHPEPGRPLNTSGSTKRRQRLTKQCTSALQLSLLHPPQPPHGRKVWVPLLTKPGGQGREVRVCGMEPLKPSMYSWWEGPPFGHSFPDDPALLLSFSQ